MTWTFHSAGSLLFGRGILGRLGEVTGRLRAKRVFVVTDAVLKKAGLVERVTGPLAAAGVTVDVFDGGQPEPALAVIRSSVTVATAFRPDAVLGLGGGSNMDA